MMDEQKAKHVLSHLLEQSGSRFTPDEIIKIFRRPKEKTAGKKLIDVLKQITNNIPYAVSYIEEFNKNSKKKDPYDNFIQFLNDLSKDKKLYSSTPKTIISGKITPQSIPLITQSEDATAMITPKTRFTGKGQTGVTAQTASAIVPAPAPVTEDKRLSEVSQIREKILQAASGGLSKTAKRTSLPAAAITPVTNSSNSLTAVCSSRPYSIWDFSAFESIPHKQSNVAAIPLTSQERIILNELLYCLIGISGEYIVAKTPEQPFEPIVFIVSTQIDVSIASVVKQILPLANYHSQIQRFIHYASAPNCGQVLQALASALRNQLDEYYMSISRLETMMLRGELNLHKLMFYLRQIIATMDVVTETILMIVKSELRGGKVLTLLHDRITSLNGDGTTQQFIIYLTQKAALPYMSILQLWIQKGMIIDPQLEFLIEDNEVIERDELSEHHYSAGYWEKRYTINRDRIPRFLEKLSDVILRTGKYLNVIRQCGKNVAPPLKESLSFSHTNQNYVTVIEAAYTFASRNLLELLIKENDLMGILLSVKRYFLLQQGDFIAQFMDACEKELSKNVDNVVPMRIESLLELTLRLSSAKSDPYNEDLKICLLPYDLITQMTKILTTEDEYWRLSKKIDLTGFECFAFRYEVRWPVSLVLNDIVISKYQMLFRHLFYCKHVERQLNQVWIATNHAKKFATGTAELYRSAFTLRQRMLNAIQNIEYYKMIEVIEPNWHIFIDKMSKVGNVDDVLQVHQDFLDQCIKNCMLTDSNLLRSIVKLCRVILDFCEFIQKTQKYFVDAELTSMLRSDENSDQSDSEYDLSSQKQSETSLAPCDTFSERVKRFDLEFTGVLIGLLQRINDIASQNPSDKFINLVHRINFNSYYSDQLVLLCAKNSMLNQNI